METLMSRTLQGHLHMGIYTCSPYIISIGVREDALFLVDTHPVGDELGGNGNGILLVTPDVSYRSCKSLVQWLLQRLKMAGVKENQSQSIIWLTPRQGKLKQNETMNFSLYFLLPIHLLKTYFNFLSSTSNSFLKFSFSFFLFIYLLHDFIHLLRKNPTRRRQDNIAPKNAWKLRRFRSDNCSGAY